MNDSAGARNPASQFNRRISIEAPTKTPNNSGGSTPGPWTPILTNTPAKIIHLPASKLGDEKFVAQQNYATRMMVVTIRYRESVNINESMRLLYRSKTYNIRSIYVPDEAQKTIVIQAEEIQTQGSAR